MDIQNQHGKSINIAKMEKQEQDLAQKYVEENDTVLELGARYGSVSCIINSKLRCKTNQVSVEPDDRVWGALERNKLANNCEFHIVKGFVSNKKLGLTNLNNYCGGYGATYIIQEDTKINSYALEDIYKKYNIEYFNVLVADCEGFLEVFFDENPTLYDTLRLIIFEADYPEKCNYNKIRADLKRTGFTKIHEGHQNVWVKKNDFNVLSCIKMGNTDSIPAHLDRPGPLMEEAARNISMGFIDAAVVKYRRAYELFKEIGDNASSARALRLAAETGLDTDCELAAKAFEEVARIYLKNPITSISSAPNFANSIYCLIASGRTTSAKEKIEEFRGLDDSFANSYEGLACKCILNSFQTGNRNSTRDCIEGFKDVKSPLPWRVKLLDRIMERL